MFEEDIPHKTTIEQLETVFKLANDPTVELLIKVGSELHQIKAVMFQPGMKTMWLVPSNRVEKRAADEW